MTDNANEPKRLLTAGNGVTFERNVALEFVRAANLRIYALAVLCAPWRTRKEQPKPVVEQTQARASCVMQTFNDEVDVSLHDAPC